MLFCPQHKGGNNFQAEEIKLEKYNSLRNRLEILVEENMKILIKTVTL